MIIITEVKPAETVGRECVLEDDDVGGETKMTRRGQLVWFPGLVT